MLSNDIQAFIVASYICSNWVSIDVVLMLDIPKTGSIHALEYHVVKTYSYSLLIYYYYNSFEIIIHNYQWVPQR